MDEAEIEAKIVGRCAKLGVDFIKFTPRGDRGWPDRIINFPNGKSMWLELKAPGKVPTNLQRHRLQHLRKMKHHAVWSDSYVTVLKVIEDNLQQMELCERDVTTYNLFYMTDPKDDYKLYND